MSLIVDPHRFHPPYKTVFDAGLSANNFANTGFVVSSSNTRTVITRIPPEKILVTGSRVRVQFLSGDWDMTFNDFFLSEASTATGALPWQNHAAPTRLTINGANSFATLAQRDAWTVFDLDVKNYVLVKTRALLLAFNLAANHSIRFGGTPTLVGSTPPVVAYYKDGVQEADDTVRTSGYGKVGNGSAFVDKIETY